MPPDLRAPEPAASERLRAPVSADSTGAAIAADRPLDSMPLPGHGGGRRAARARGRSGPRRDRRGDRVRRRRAGPAAGPASRTPRSSGSSGGSGTATRSAGIHPHLATEGLRVFDAVPDDAEAVFLALPHGAAAARIDEFQAARPDRHRPRARLPPARPRGLSALVPLRPSRGRTCWRPPSTACPSCIGRSSPRPARRAERDRRRARLLRDDHDPRARPARTRRPHRRTSSSTRRAASRAPAASPRRTSSSARSTRASRRTASSPTATSARSSRSSARWAAGWRPTRASAASTSCPTSSR